MDVLVSRNTYKFRLVASKDGVIWDISGATVKIAFKMPDGSVAIRAATITNAAGGVAEYDSLTSDLAQTGRWFKSWKIKQGSIAQEGDPETFSVVAGMIP